MQIKISFPNRLLTVPEVATFLNASVKTVYRRISDGELNVIRDGRNVRVAPDDLARYISDHRST